MNPKKPKEFIKPTAETLEVSETLVDDVIGFYWRTVRKALSDLESPSITVTNLGTFNVRYNKIPLLEEKYQGYLDKLEAENMTFNKHTIQNHSKKKLEGLERVRLKLEEEYERKKEVRKKRKEYVTNKAVEE
jgi:hypothetical protein